MDIPSISAIIPVYNTQKHLRRCVDSILAQTFRDFELLLIDDGSTDASGAICDEYAAADSRVRAFHKPNGGVSSARNLGIAKAIGKYVAFIDSDDRIVYYAFQRLIDIMRNAEPDCVIFGIRKESGGILQLTEDTTFHSQKELRNNFAELLNDELLSNGANKLYRRNLIKSQFCEEMTYGEDLAFNLEYFKNANTIRIIPDLLYIYNDAQSESITKRFNPQKLFDIERYQAKVLDFIDNESIKNFDSLSKKYMRDAIQQLHAVYTCSDISECSKTINGWYSSSHLKRHELSLSGIGIKDRLMFFCIKNRIPQLYACIARIKRTLRKYR